MTAAREEVEKLIAAGHRHVVPKGWHKNVVEALTALLAENGRLQESLTRTQNSDEHNFARWQQTQEELAQLKASQEALRVAKEAMKHVLEDEVTMIPRAT